MELVKKTYQPVSCDFYDELTWIVLQNKPVVITYLQDMVPITTLVILRDIQTKNKAEYVITDSGLEIRLDYLVEVNGKFLINYC